MYCFQPARIPAQFISFAPLALPVSMGTKGSNQNAKGFFYLSYASSSSIYPIKLVSRRILVKSCRRCGKNYLFCFSLFTSKVIEDGRGNDRHQLQMLHHFQLQQLCNPCMPVAGHPSVCVSAQVATCLPIAIQLSACPLAY